MAAITWNGIDIPKPSPCRFQRPKIFLFCQPSCLFAVLWLFFTCFPSFLLIFIQLFVIWKFPFQIFLWMFENWWRIPHLVLPSCQVELLGESLQDGHDLGRHQKRSAPTAQTEKMPISNMSMLGVPTGSILYVHLYDNENSWKFTDFVWWIFGMHLHEFMGFPDRLLYRWGSWTALFQFPCAEGFESHPGR